MPATSKFESISPAKPTADGIASRYQACHHALDNAGTAAARVDVVRHWDQLMRELDTWESLTDLHFSQDTRNESYREAQNCLDELKPKLTDMAVTWKKRLLQEPLCSELREAFGDQAIAIWTADVASFDPAMEAALVAESKVESQYTELLAGAEVVFQGETRNLSDMRKYLEHPDRDARHGAVMATWGWYARHREQLDAQFDQLVRLRHEMAATLGDPSYVELGYRRMLRIDYAENDVRTFRDAVRERVTPLCLKLVERQRETLGLDGSVMYWDEALLSPGGNPRPQGDHDWMMSRAREMFDDIGNGLGAFFRQMSDGGFMDLKNRPGKAGGGFCTSFASEGMPFIFANFNGSKGDVEVFTHEIGHAFQNFMSRDQPLFDYCWPTYESCEIHSMGLEFLTWPQMERFFGEEAEAFRRVHLEESLRFLPYGVAVDHFQHLVYQRPQATAAERHAMWREVEQMYLPWRDYGDVPHANDGGFWQQQRHIYTSPFYYIDYTLAMTCAMQLWVRAEKDFEQAMQAYVSLCKRGGEAPFRDLVASAGLRSPFEPGCLDDVVAAAEAFLSV